MDKFRKDPVVHNALGSATASIISRIFTHPLDTAKARLQAPISSAATSAVSSSSAFPYRGPLDVLVKTWQTEGIRGLYRGFGAILVGGTPGTMLYLCSYEVIKHRLTDWWEATTGVGRYSTNTLPQESDKQNQRSSSGDEYFLVHFFSGMLAETIACVVYVPVDVIKERLQVQQRQLASNATSPTNSYYYRGSLDALIQISKTEGLSGIYRGYFATLASFGPFSALYFVFYERTKHWARQYVHDQQQKQYSQQPPEREQDSNMDLPFSSIVLCSASSGALASWLTSPLDMAKLRLQVQRGQAAAATASSSPSQLVTSYRGVWDCLRTAYGQGGVRALFRGAGA
jgi:hypothetical protein